MSAPLEKFNFCFISGKFFWNFDVSGRMTIILFSSLFLWRGFMTAIAILLVSFIVKFVIKPLYLCSFYQQQGMPRGRFFPVMGYVFYSVNSPGNKKGDPYFYFKELRKAQPDGKSTMVFPYMDTAQILIGELSDFQQFIALQTKYYAKDPYFVGPLIETIGKGLLCTEFDKWKTQRKLVSQAFHFEFIQENLPLVARTADDIIRQFPFNGRSTITIKAIEEYQKITGDVVCKIFFGQQVSNKILFGKPLSGALAEIMTGLAAYAASFPNFLFGPKFQKLGIRKKDRELNEKIKMFRATLGEMIRDEKEALAKGTAKGKEGSLARLLLEEVDENGLKLTEEEVLHQFMTFFLAGMDTTAHLAGIVTYYLCTYPKYKDEIIKELDQFIKDEQDLIIENLNKLDLFTNFIKETLRLNTPIAGVLPRIATEDHTLGKYKIKKGTIVNSIFFYINCFDERYFPNPSEFRPERWAGADAPDKKHSPFVFTPFSAGARNCIGQHLAQLEAKIIIWTMLKRFKISLPPDFKLRMVQRFTLEPEDDIPLIIERIS